MLNKISEEVLQVLNTSRVDGNKLFLPPSLERKLYVKTNDALTSIGAIWNKKLKCHLSDTDIEEKLEEIINTGEYESEISKKKLLNFFPTPLTLAELMVDMAKIGGFHEVLEPSAGRGNIVSKIMTKTPCHVVEIDKENYEYCINKYNCVGYKENGNTDFLTLFPEDKFDRVVMNPPFSVKGHTQCDIAHIQHAFNFLKKGGVLVSVISESPFFRENSKSTKFRQWLLEKNGETHTLPKDTFKESGTMVSTRLVKLIKE